MEKKWLRSFFLASLLILLSGLPLNARYGPRQEASTCYPPSPWIECQARCDEFWNWCVNSTIDDACLTDWNSQCVTGYTPCCRSALGL